MADSTANTERTCTTCGVSIAHTYKLRRYCDEHTPAANTKAKRPCPDCGKPSFSKKSRCQPCSAARVKQCKTCGTTDRRVHGNQCSPCRWAQQGEAECGTCGQSKKIMARGMCGACYSAAHRAVNGRNEKTHPITCEQCGKHHEATEPQTRYCSLRCAGLAFSASRPPAPPKPPKPAPTPDEIETRRRSRRGPLSAAYEDGDHDAVISELRRRSMLTSEGCWEWQQRMSRGYPEVTMLDKTYAVHRVALEAKERAPLGSQQSHHVCANTACVNPDHLQPATYAENIGEMKARQSYIARIAELEQALAEVMPGHQLLHRARYAS